jgi:hypothetical protein
VPQELEVRIAEEVRDIVLHAGEEVVDAKDVLPFLQKPLAQVGSDEPRPAGDEHALADVVASHTDPGFRRSAIHTAKAKSPIKDMSDHSAIDSLRNVQSTTAHSPVPENRVFSVRDSGKFSIMK